MTQISSSILVLFVICLASFKAVSSQRCSADESCVQNGTTGINMLDYSCGYFLRLQKSLRYAHGWCGSDGDDAIICCPQARQSVKKLCDSFGTNPRFEISERIIGGSRSDVGEFPHFAALTYQDVEKSNVTFDCGGALISNKHVLTAAHCIRENQTPHLVRLGSVSKILMFVGLKGRKLFLI